MNEYIRPIFESVLPKIESAKIQYWIYGGIGNAAMVDKLYRSTPNSDVDLIILQGDFKKCEEIFNNLCTENNWKIRKTNNLGRQKIELIIIGKERLSVIPAIKKENHVELKFKGGSGIYPLDILEQEIRELKGFTFSTLSNKWLKELFIEYLKSKNNSFSNKSIYQKRVEDGRHILSEEEFKEYFPNESYTSVK